MKIAVLTSKESWFVPYSERFVASLKSKGLEADLFFSHKQIDGSYQIVFMLSYFKITSEAFLENHKHNLVVHESDLPSGKGWAPLFWQVIEGKNKIPVVLFEAGSGVDDGDIFIKDHIELEGHELHDGIRKKQGLKTIEMCKYFIKNYENMSATPQNGHESKYAKRTAKDSELDVNKSLSDQFDLLRTVNNDDFPAFFNHGKHKYILKIFKAESH
ncbi:MAG: methionyl-tRNA formyltransferase [Planctomycetes bacterium]|nr:methionyl-tRNA formyltransferase [Planctomycetota bacterium]